MRPADFLLAFELMAQGLDRMDIFESHESDGAHQIAPPLVISHNQWLKTHDICG